MEEGKRGRKREVVLEGDSTATQRSGSRSGVGSRRCTSSWFRVCMGSKEG